MRWSALALIALALTGCETTAEKSAQLERQAARGVGAPAALKGLSIARQSRDVKVLDATLLRSSEASAAVVTLRNLSSHVLRALPIAISVKDSHGRTLLQNNAPGLEAGLVSIGSLAPHAQLTWVDDQLPVLGASATLSARIGEGAGAAGALPAVAVSAVHLFEDPSNGLGASGTVRNGSRTAQQKLVIFVVARRGARVVAGARAVLPALPAGASIPFQAFFVGDPRGAQLQAIAPPTSAG